MSYVVAKHIHIACVALSGSLFLLRGIWTWRQSAVLRAQWLRVLPHVVDTLLLASAITMAVVSRQYPFVQGWLTAKVIALAAYIALGTVALKPGRESVIRVTAFFGAMATFAYIVGVAVTKRAAIFS
ncbi:MAG TPA: SirB2 family protein [Casimicrobiaceae bacterium]|nr:SirB2 family protein [Casimicrobiaceae bacterium]